MKALKIAAGVAVAVAALAILDPVLYNDLLDALIRFLVWIHHP